MSNPEDSFREGEAPAEPHRATPDDPGSARASPFREVPVRHRPAHGVFPVASKPTIVYLTVCTRNRQPWLADADAHDLIRTVWAQAEAWLVGCYVLMPDHLHLFATPNQEAVALERWVQYWKSQFTKRHGNPAHRWQSDHWDRRLRTDDDYEAKWEYVRNNPVRRGLVEHPDDWPFRGELHGLEW